MRNHMRLVVFAAAAIWAATGESDASLLLNDSGFTATRIQNPGTGGLAGIKVGSNPVQIDQIGIVVGNFYRIDVVDNQATMVPINEMNIKFIIGQGANNTDIPLFVSSPQTITDRTMQLRLSSVFPPITLMPGQTYSIGYIGDFGSQIGLRPGDPLTQNGLTNLPGGSIYSNYNDPRFIQGVGGVTAIQLFGTVAVSTAVPEPSTVASLGLAGLIGLAARFRRRLLMLA